MVWFGAQGEKLWRRELPGLWLQKDSCSYSCNCSLQHSLAGCRWFTAPEVDLVKTSPLFWTLHFPLYYGIDNDSNTVFRNKGGEGRGFACCCGPEPYATSRTAYWVNDIPSQHPGSGPPRQAAERTPAAELAAAASRKCENRVYYLSTSFS